MRGHFIYLKVVKYGNPRLKDLFRSWPEIAGEIHFQYFGDHPRGQDSIGMLAFGRTIFHPTVDKTPNSKLL